MNALADLPAAAQQPIAVALPVDALRPNPWNRKKYDPAKFVELVDSVRKIGLLQAIVVRPIDHPRAEGPTHEIVAGERRWRACREAGFAEIPATVRSLTDLELIEALLIENTEREEMNALDEAQCLQAMLRKPGELQGYANPEELATRIGRSRAYVYQRIKLLTLCEDAQAALREGSISANHALRLSRLASAADQAEALKACLRGWGGNPMSVRDLEEHIHRTYMLDLARAPFPIKSESLLSAAGSCTACPKRSGNAPDLFEDVKKGDTCTDGACYQAKTDAHREALKAQAEAEGKTVITGAAAKKAKPQQYGDLKGFLELDKVHHQLGDKPLRKLLGKHPLEVQLLEDPHSGDLVHVVAEEPAVKLLKERGVLKTSRMPTTSASERQAEAKAKAEKAWRYEAGAACVAAAGGEVTAQLRDRMVWQVAELLWREMPHDTRERVTKLMAWPPLPSNWQAGTGKTVAAHFDALSASQLLQYFTACTIAADLVVNQYNNSGKPERLLATAEALGVDVAGIKARCRAENLQRVKGKASQAKEAKAAAAKGRPAATPETALAQALKNAKPARGVKYRNPATGDTWSGRGLQPRWLKQALAEGRQLADFAVEQAAPKAHISDAAANVVAAQA